jgi:hypothetical protein
MIKQVDRVNFTAQNKAPTQKELPIIQCSHPDNCKPETASVSADTLNAYFIPQKNVAFNGLFSKSKSDKQKLADAVKLISEAKDKGEIKNYEAIDKTEKGQGMEYRFEVNGTKFELEDVEITDLGFTPMPVLVKDTSQFCITITKPEGNQDIIFLTKKEFQQIKDILDK